MNCAIIIPCINLDNETKLCVKKCLKQKNIKIKIYIVSDKKIIRQKKDKKIKYLSYGPINMSEKRNKAVKRQEKINFLKNFIKRYLLVFEGRKLSFLFLKQRYVFLYFHLLGLFF